MKVLLLGNCQVLSAGALLKISGYKDLTTLRFNAVTATHRTPEWMSQFDAIIAHDTIDSRPALREAVLSHNTVIQIPVMFFDGFSPDDDIRFQLAPDQPPHMMSKIAVGAFYNGLTRDEALTLYNPTFCDLLGYDRALEQARVNMFRRLAHKLPQISQLYAKWMARGVFFYTSNHPKLFVIEDVLRHALKGRSDLVVPAGISDFCADPLLSFGISPQMNHPAATNLLHHANHQRKQGPSLISCRQFLDHCYDMLEANRATIVNGKAPASFTNALTQWRAHLHKPADKAVNPYRSQPAQAYWNRAVARPAVDAVTPIGQTAVLIERDTRVATAGSCFAQHVARAMVADGLTYYVAEQAPDALDAETAEQHGYGLFSARYGNIYSSRQLLQLIQRAYGDFKPLEDAWPVEGGFVDPLRPNIGQVFDSPEAVEDARAQHLGKVRDMFENLDVFVFTMGLTESWADRRDGTVFPVAPAAVSQGITPEHYEFINSDYDAVRADMTAFLAYLGKINPKARVILTVSPVPLIATYTDSDALSATTYSKSVLRAVAGDLATTFDTVFYFPSYEIITGSYTRGSYFDTDLRSVRPEGVAHVMRVFRERLVAKDGDAPLAQPVVDDSAPSEDYITQLNVVCDEEMLVR